VIPQMAAIMFPEVSSNPESSSRPDPNHFSLYSEILQVFFSPKDG